MKLPFVSRKRHEKKVKELKEASKHNGRLFLKETVKSNDLIDQLSRLTKEYEDYRAAHPKKKPFFSHRLNN